MKILSCVSYGYYDRPLAGSYEYLSFVTVLRDLGHRVHHFDHRHQSRIDPEAAGDLFLSLVRRGGYDLVLVVNTTDTLPPGVLAEAKEHARTVAWNCDDDWRWEEVGAPRAELFTHMVTTYRHVFEARRGDHPNLLLGQWGCTGLCDGAGVAKAIPVSFVGSCYGPRGAQIARLRRKLGLRAFGKGIRASGGPLHRRARRLVARLLRIPWHEDDTTLPDQDAVKDVWNRSRISFTPLDSGPGSTLQVKARVFDMGLSGTLMLCPVHEALHEWYEPGKEYVEYEDLDDCVEKARWYLAHEEERRSVAAAYRRRTEAEHLWRHRFEALFRDLGR